jgi:hypothetical protein
MIFFWTRRSEASSLFSIFYFGFWLGWKKRRREKSEERGEKLPQTENV